MTKYLGRWTDRWLSGWVGGWVDGEWVSELMAGERMGVDRQVGRLKWVDGQTYDCVGGYVKYNG